MTLTLPEYYYDGSFQEFKQVLTADLDTVKLPANTQLVTAGEYMRHTYYVHQGILKFYIIAENGKEKTELFIGQDGIFPLYSPLERRYKGERDELLVKTQTSATLTKIPQMRIERLVTTNPSFAKRMLRQYADMSSILLYDVINLTAQDNLTKICNYLYQYKRLLQPHGIQLTQDEIAVNIGIPRLTLSRYLKRLRQIGIITTARKQIEVTDWPRLVALCSSELINKRE